MTNGGVPPTPALQFPTHNAPRVWLLTSGDSPIGVSLARKVLDHGDYVVSGIIPSDFERDGARSEDFQDFLAEVSRKAAAGWKERLRVVTLDVRCAFPALRALFGLFEIRLHIGK
jgi:NAD(P)-dependent dehydrogenase (short-subunit alcohol dehydrogenase family)